MTQLVPHGPNLPNTASRTDCSDTFIPFRLGPRCQTHLAPNLWFPDRMGDCLWVLPWKPRSLSWNALPKKPSHIMTIVMERWIVTSPGPFLYLPTNYWKGLIYVELDLTPEDLVRTRAPEQGSPGHELPLPTMPADHCYRNPNQCISQESY